jgi:D-alanyl-D-alanine carboxypeptidase
MGRILDLRRFVPRLLALLIAVGLVAGSTLGYQVTAAEIARYEPLAPPPLSADAVFVADLTSGTELFALNPDTALPPASLTKLVSALVVREHANLDDEIEILEDDLVSAKESQVGLVAGDRVSTRDLLLGMLIPSGNDATLTLSRHVGRTVAGDDATPEQAVAGFVSLMNEKAHELGADASHFENPTGMDAEGHVMSARDVATIAAAALNDPLIAEIVATPSAVLESTLVPEGYSVTTTNLLLQEGAVTGVKTGTTPKAGGCLVTSYAVGPNQIVAVILGSDLTEGADGSQDSSARFSETRALMDAVTSDFVWLDPAAPGVVSGLLEELGVWDVGFADHSLLPVPAATASEIRYRLVLHPPAAPQDQAGEVQFFIGDRLLSARPALQSG